MSRTIKLGDKDLPIRATPLAKLMKVMPALEKVMADPAALKDGSTAGMEEAAVALGEAVFHGIRRAGGEVTQEFVADNIDMTNMKEVFAVFFEVNGLAPKKDGAGSGEGQAGQV